MSGLQKHCKALSNNLCHPDAMHREVANGLSTALAASQCPPAMLQACLVPAHSCRCASVHFALPSGIGNADMEGLGCHWWHEHHRLASAVPLGIFVLQSSRLPCLKAQKHCQGVLPDLGL